MGGTSSTPLPSLAFGPHSVGCVDIMTGGGNSQTNEPLFARLFYPTSLSLYASNTKDQVPWVPREDYIHGLAAFIKRSGLLLRTVRSMLIGSRTLCASWQAPLIDMSTVGKLPVMVYSPGLGSARWLQSLFCCSMASVGYAVLCLEHGDRSGHWTYRLKRNADSNELVEKRLPYRHLQFGEKEFKLRNTQVQQRASECVAAYHLLELINSVDIRTADSFKSQFGDINMGQTFDWAQFKDRLDLSSPTVCGHSFGGATALVASAVSSDFKCCIALDCWMFPIDRDLYAKVYESRVPTLFLNAGRFQWDVNVQQMGTMFRDRIGQDVHLFTIPQAAHYDFCDLPYVLPEWVAHTAKVSGGLPKHVGTQLAVDFVTKLMTTPNASSCDFDELLTKYSEWVIKGSDLSLTPKEEVAQGDGAGNTQEEVVENRTTPSSSL